MSVNKYNNGDVLKFTICSANKDEDIALITITNYIDDGDASRYEYTYNNLPNVTFIALRSHIEPRSTLLTDGGGMTRRNKLRKKRRKTNRRR